MRNRDIKLKSNKKSEKREEKEVPRRPALIPVPSKLSLLIDLVNLLPLHHRKLPNPVDLPISDLGVMYRQQIYFWNTKDDQNSISAIYYLQRLVETLPIELQAFVLNDEHGQLHEDEDTQMLLPFFDFQHRQPLGNIGLLRRPETELRDLVARAVERIRVEVRYAEERIKAQVNKSSREKQPERAMMEYFNQYRVDNIPFREVGLNTLADRARRRFFFILAADEILDALVGPDTQKKLNRTMYIEQSGATDSHPYIENDEVKIYPPILFLFVMGVQISRIRRCGICANYFWAGRKDKMVCSSRCNATQRKRQERQRYFERKIGVRKRRGKARKES
jgi:predicted nucleic acid-binding Zn ribbon protein